MVLPIGPLECIFCYNGANLVRRSATKFYRYTGSLALYSREYRAACDNHNYLCDLGWSEITPQDYLVWQIMNT